MKVAEKSGRDVRGEITAAAAAADRLRGKLLQFTFCRPPPTPTHTHTPPLEVHFIQRATSVLKVVR